MPLAAAIKEQLNELDSVAVAGGERHDATETILTGISRLSDEVLDAGDFIPAYDQRTYAQVSLHDECQLLVPACPPSLAPNIGV